MKIPPGGAGLVRTIRRNHSNNDDDAGCGSSNRISGSKNDDNNDGSSDDGQSGNFNGSSNDLDSYSDSSLACNKGNINHHSIDSSNDDDRSNLSYESSCDDNLRQPLQHHAT